jgi:phosphatidylinositol-3-phosphatase
LVYKKLAYCLTTIVLLVACGTTVQIPATNRTDNVSSAPPSPLGARLMEDPPKHIVLVIEENHSYTQIAGNSKAPYINSLMKQGATFTDYHGVEHPSQANYLDLFSGSNQGVTNDSCPHTFSSPNLASELIAAHLSFGGYVEDLPSVGYTGCSNRHFWWTWGVTYARKHCPWINFTNVPASGNIPFTSFPHDFSKLPTIAFVIPNLKHDMHSGSIEAADSWLKQNIQPYVQWAKTHDSLLVVTWDEDDDSAKNHIPTFVVGPMIRPGTYSKEANHFNMLGTIEDLYGLSRLGKSAGVAPLTDMWQADHT